MKSNRIRKGIRRSKKEDVFLLFSTPDEEVVVVKKKRGGGLDHGEFIVWFMKEYERSINRHIFKHMIPNRYSASDVKAYIMECILRTLKRREDRGEPIQEPKIYFRGLIQFYCVEFQRMHGYIYGMPKRPRSVEAEKEISQYGFMYFNSVAPQDFQALTYVDSNVDDPNEYHHLEVKGQDPNPDSTTWDNMMLMALPEDQEVLECIFMMNMSVPEASRHLGIAVSTAYQRKERGVRAISGTLASYVDLDDPSWKVFESVAKLEEDRIDIRQFYETGLP